MDPVLRKHFTAFLVFCTASVAVADVIVVGAKTHRGTFENYARDTFRFRLKDGKALKVKRMSVKKLTLKKPLKGTLTQSARPPSLQVQLLGYDKSKFIYRDGDTRREASGMRVKSFTPERDPRWAVPGTRSEKLPTIDISRLEDRKDLAPEQIAVLDRYKAAKREHDEFVAESSRLVAKLDRAVGSRRSELLNVLRKRKQDEQPLKQAFSEASDDLLELFPSRRR